MATKNNPGEFDCYADAAPDEPIFILRATDRLAPKKVRDWAAAYAVTKAAESNARGEGERLTPKQLRKVEEAYTCADAMEEWRDKQPACPVCGSVHVRIDNCDSCGFSAT